TCTRRSRSSAPSSGRRASTPGGSSCRPWAYLRGRPGRCGGMRRYGAMYDGTRGLTTAGAAGGAGLLPRGRALLGRGAVDRVWASMGIVAGAGLVLALSQLIGGWTKGGRVRISPATFLLAFVPVLVCVGWILMATQPGSGWHEGRVVSWSHSIGIFGLV